MSEPIKLTDLGIVAPGGRTLLRDGELDFHPGEITLLVGPSGSGKSTLAHAICGLLDSRLWTLGGALSMDGETVDLGEHRPDLGALVFQTSALFDDLTLAQNVEIARDSAAAPLQELPGAGLELVRSVDPTAYPAQASGGMRQRVAILRALVGGRRLLVLDEPNSGLDPANAAYFAQSLRELCSVSQTAALVVVHHFDDLLPFADAVVVLDPTTATLTRVPPDAGIVQGHLARIAGDSLPSGDFASAWAGRIAPGKGRRWWSPLFFGKSLVDLGLNPLAVSFIAVGSAIGAATATILSFNFRNVGWLLIPLLHDEILGRLGLLLTTIGMPLLASLLLATRNSAVIAAKAQALIASSQREAMRNAGVSLARYVVAPTLASSVILFAVFGALAGVVGATASLASWTYLFPDPPAALWREMYFANLLAPGRLGSELAMTGLKQVASGLASGAAALAIGLRPSSPARAGAVANAIVLGALLVLLIHAMLTVVTLKWLAL